MNKIVVFWTGSGNTEEIGNKIADDLSCKAVNINDTSVEEVLGNDLIIFGCPAMGCEELEESEFRPFYEKVMEGIEEKKVALFGSYGWGDGEWMRSWEAEVGANLVCKGLTANGGASDINDDEYEVFINSLK